MNSQTFKGHLLLAVLVLFLPFSAFGKDKKPDPKQLESDLKALESLARLFPVENKTEADFRSTLAGFSGNDNAPELGDLGFGWEKRVFYATGHHSRMTVTAFFFEKQLANLEIVRRTDDPDWSFIGQPFLQKWRDLGLPDYTVGKNDIHLRRSNPEQIRKYQAAVSGQLGNMSSRYVPSEFEEDFNLLTTQFELEMVAFQGCGDSGRIPLQSLASRRLFKAGRFDLLAEALKGYSPSGRFYAFWALVKARKNGASLSPETLSAMTRVEELPIRFSPCFGCLMGGPSSAGQIKALFLQILEKSSSDND